MDVKNLQLLPYQTPKGRVGSWNTARDNLGAVPLGARTQKYGPTFSTMTTNGAETRSRQIRSIRFESEALTPPQGQAPGVVENEPQRVESHGQNSSLCFRPSSRLLVVFNAWEATRTIVVDSVHFTFQGSATRTTNTKKDRRGPIDKADK